MDADQDESNLKFHVHSQDLFANEAHLLQLIKDKLDNETPYNPEEHGRMLDRMADRFLFLQENTELNWKGNSEADSSLKQTA